MKKAILSVLWKRMPRSLRRRLLWTFSDKFLVGVTGVVLNACDELLLAHHVYRTRIVWGLPSGGVKLGESLACAMYREILEETGVSVQVRHLLQINLDEQPALLNCYFLCTVDGMPEPQVSAELFEAGFYPLNALPAAMDPGQWAFVQRAWRVRAGIDRPAILLRDVHGNWFP